MASDIPSSIGSKVGESLASQSMKSAAGLSGGGILASIGSKAAGAGGAVKDAGLAVSLAGGQLIADGARATVSAISANMFLLVATFTKFLQGYITNWTFSVNSFTLYIDIAMLFYAVVAFKKDKLDKAVAGFIAFIVFASYLIPLAEKVILKSAPMLSYPILVLIIAGITIYMLYKKGDYELAFIFAMFIMEIGMPFLNVQFHQFFVVNRWTVLLLFWPYWAMCSVKYANTKLSAAVFIGMLVFVMLFFKPFTFAALDQFQVQNEISPEQKDQMKTGWQNVKSTLSDGIAALGCGWQAAIYNDNSCYQELQKKQEAGQQIQDSLELQFYRFKNDQIFYLNQDSFEYTMNLRLKNKEAGTMKVDLTCGISSRPEDIAESDEQTGTIIGQNPVTVKSGEIFDRTIRCKVPSKPDPNKATIFYRARLHDMQGTAQIRRLIVERRDSAEEGVYAQIIQSKFPGGNYNSVATKGFASLDLAIDRTGAMIELPRGDSFVLYPSLFNNGDGHVLLKTAQVTLGDGLTAVDCTGYDPAKRTFSLDLKSQPFDEMKKTQFMAFPSCSITLADDASVAQAGQATQPKDARYPTLYTIDGKITYDYSVTGYEQLDIRSPRRNANTNSSTPKA